MQMISMLGVAAKRPRAKTMLWSVKTDNTGTTDDDQFKFRVASNGVYDCTVDWGDGSTPDDITTYNDAAWTHTFDGGAGTYDIEVTGQFELISFNNLEDCLKLVEIKRWGADFRFDTSDTYNSYFFGCANLVVTATDIPNLTGLKTLRNAFRGCTAMVSVPNIGSWDITGITTMLYMFYESQISTANYDSLLIGWESQSITNAISFWAGSSTYTSGGAAATARAALISDHSWSFTDGGTA